ncbi:MAG: hypothetical protein H8D45_14795 [Bacteroidetes bacterium]|nr:hypothetical protein [Bacteroidota bacterium]
MIQDTRLYIVFSLLFLIGCSGIRHKTGTKPQRKPFSDPEIAAFMEESESFEEDKSRPFSLEQQYAIRKRPPWATTKFINPETDNYIARVGYSEIGNRSRQEVADSLRNQTRELVSGDVETRVEHVIIDSVSTIVMHEGKRKPENIRKHVLKVISRHYSPPLTFNSVYDQTDIWVDENNDTLWCFINFNRTKYIQDQQQRIVEEIRKASEQAYQYLKTSFRALSHDADVEKALTALGMVSYYISRGGGAANEEDLFNPGTKQSLLVQRHELIKEIDKSIGIRLINSKDEKIVTRDKSFKAKIITHRNTKGYDLNRVKLRIHADSDVVDYPEIVNLEPDGSAEIPFSPKIDVYGQTVGVSITFDVISMIIPDKKWYEKPDYKDLLKELPGIDFKIVTKEFTPIQTWAIIHSDIPGALHKESDFFQKILEAELSKYPNFINVIPHKNWPVDYTRVRAYKSGKISYQDMGNDRQEVQKHDLDIMLQINRDHAAMSYTMMLEGTGPKKGEAGKITNQIDVKSASDIKKTIGTIVQQFVAEHFHREICLVTPVRGDIRVFVNSKKRTLQKTPDNRLVLRGLSRFETQELIAESPGYRRQVFSVGGEPFSLQMTPRPVSSFEMGQLVPVHGTLKVIVTDSLTGRPIRYGGKGEGNPPVIKVRKRYGFFSNPFNSIVSDTSYRASIPIKKLGKYSVKVSKQFYNPPLFSKIVTVYDDEDPLSMQSNSIRFSLLKKDPKVARVKSAIVPGWGHWTLGKKKEGFGFFSSTVVTVVWGAFQYIKFQNEVENYNQLREDYITSNEQDWEDYEDRLSQSKVRIKNHRNQVYGTLVTSGIVWGYNLLTVTW